jgi:cytochrome c553
MKVESRQERKIMKLVTVLAPAALFVAIFCSAAGADDIKTSAAAKPETVPPREFQAKAGYCETCHGLSARGFIGTNPMPRLAGQQPDYIKNQLQAFIDRRRLNPVMGNVAHVLSPAMVDALATHFRDLDPPPYGGAPKELMSEGEKIYHEGVPSAEVPACDSCHGQDAHGIDQFPRLAGQLNGYMIAKLTNWSKERGQDPKNPDNSEIMGPIAEKLTNKQIAAVAAYVSDLK